MLSDDELNAIERRAEAATAGPWFSQYPYRVQITHSVNREIVAEAAGKCPLYPGSSISRDQRKRNSAFIAHARTDIPALLAHIREMEGEHSKCIMAHRASIAEGFAAIRRILRLDDEENLQGACERIMRERDEARTEVEALNQKLIGWSLPTTGTFEERLMRLIEQERAAAVDLSPEVGALRAELQSIKQAHADLCRAHDGYRDEVVRLTKLLDYCAVCGKTVADERCSLADDEMSPCTFPPKCMERIHAAEIEVARLRDVLISLSVASDIQFSEAAFNRVQQVIDDTERANDA